MNSLVLHAALEQFVLPPGQWGDGVSVKMLNRFKEDSFDRMRLCVADWEGTEKRPAVAEKANQTDYLFGTYDSVVTTHQWANGSLKYRNILDTAALTALPYMVPPNTTK